LESLFYFTLFSLFVELNFQEIVNFSENTTETNRFFDAIRIIGIIGSSSKIGLTDTRRGGLVLCRKSVMRKK